MLHIIIVWCVERCVKHRQAEDSFLMPGSPFQLYVCSRVKLRFVACSIGTLLLRMSQLVKETEYQDSMSLEGILKAPTKDSSLDSSQYGPGTVLGI